MRYTDSNCNTMRYAWDLLSSVRLREFKKQRMFKETLCKRLSWQISLSIISSDRAVVGNVLNKELAIMYN